MNRVLILNSRARFRIKSVVGAAPKCRIALSMVLIVLLLSSTAAAQSDLKSEKLRQRMQQAVDRGRISGVVTLVSHKGTIVHHQAVGKRTLDPQQPMKTDSVFAIASMTKPITATAVMILRDEGKLSIEDAVSKYIPEFKQAALKTGPPKREITIRDLLTHTSGLVGSQRAEGSLKQTAELLAERPLGFEPGARWQYSPGLNICGRLIEIVSGKPYEQFLAERIFKPLKMDDTTFAPSAQQQSRLAQLFRPAEDKKSLVAASHWINDLSQKKTPNPSGGLFSTASDMARFYQAILNGGQLDGHRIVSETAVKQMTRVQTGTLKTGFTPGNGWGLGWCLVRQPQGATAMLSPGSFGHGGAFGTQGWVDPQRKMIFVLMIQRTGFGNSDASELRRDFQQLAVDAIVK